MTGLMYTEYKVNEDMIGEEPIVTENKQLKIIAANCDTVIDMRTEHIDALEKKCNEIRSKLYANMDVSEDIIEARQLQKKITEMKREYNLALSLLINTGYTKMLREDIGTVLKSNERKIIDSERYLKSITRKTKRTQNRRNTKYTH